MGSPSR